MTVSTSLAAMLLAGATMAPGTEPFAVGSANAPLVNAQSVPMSGEMLPLIAVPPPPVVATLPHATGSRPSPAPAPGENEIVVRARARAAPGDPLQAVNAKSFAITQAVDTAVIRPVALTYQRIVPDPIRSGIRNFINNLREPVVFLNFMLQLKLGKAVETVGRFGINSTIGAGGLFDIARRRPFKLPRRPNGLANTLGYYGVKSGPFLFLPIIGPTTLRDLVGDNLDRLVLPVAVGKPFNKPLYAIPIGVFSSLDQRAEYDEKLEAIKHSSTDPYTARREDYLRARQRAIDALHSQKWRDAHPRDPQAVNPAGH